MADSQPNLAHAAPQSQNKTPKKKRTIREMLRGILWNMRGRCEDKRHKGFARYGGRGISICNEWLSFEVFIEWGLSSGYKPGLQIDRIDNNGNYCPENCRWVTNAENSRNREACVFVTAFGETKTVEEWARDARCVVYASCIHDRIRRGINPEAAITTPQILSRGASHHRSVSMETFLRVKELIESGMSNMEIQRKLGVQNTLASRMRRGKTWHSLVVMGERPEAKEGRK